jgi:2-keto-4-pentenoate hydratase
MWTLFGVTEPVWGYVYQHTLTECPDGKIHFDLSKLCQPRIEPEVVLHFRDAPPADAKEMEILRWIDWIAHGVEIVQSHFPDWKFKAADTVADNGLHGALIVGPHIQVDQLGKDLPSALEAFSVELSCNGELREKGHGRNVLGNPLTAVKHLLELLCSQGDMAPITAGEVITTGTITKAYPIKTGEKWSTTLRGIGLQGLELTFV